MFLIIRVQFQEINFESGSASAIDMSAPMASSNAGGEDVESEEGTLQLAVPRVSKLEDVAFSNASR